MALLRNSVAEGCERIEGVLIADCYSGYTGISLRSHHGITHDRPCMSEEQAPSQR
jgi:hypothetical protein